jgi:hypothetical protein
MGANEITMVSQQYQNRVKAILKPVELACFDSYQQRVKVAIARRDTAPVVLAPDEQMVLDKIAQDPEAVALRTQLDVLLRIETLPQ